MRAYVAVFVSVFLAELGDTTQLATLFFAANPEISKLGVLVASAAALCLSTTLAGLAGSSLGASTAPRHGRYRIRRDRDLNVLRPPVSLGAGAVQDGIG